MVSIFYNGICRNAPLPLCGLVGNQSYRYGPICYARSIGTGSSLIFQPATMMMELVSVIMTLVMIYSIKSKYTAVGRKEMVMFFYLFLLSSIMECVIISGVIPVSSNFYPHCVAGHHGLISATIFCLMLNGFVGFQFAEDGTFWSLWTIRIISLIVFGLSYLISIFTFLNFILNNQQPIVLWTWMYLINGLALFIYATLQILLVFNTLYDKWPIGNIILGLTCFLAGQLLLNFYSTSICEGLGHYLDGSFFTVTLTLLSVMMIYKYWDSITTEDLEFSIQSNQNIWEVKWSSITHLTTPPPQCSSSSLIPTTTNPHTTLPSTNSPVPPPTFTDQYFADPSLRYSIDKPNPTPP